MHIVSVISVLRMLLYHNSKNDLHCHFLYHVKFLLFLKDRMRRAELRLWMHSILCLVGYYNWNFTIL